MNQEQSHSRRNTDQRSEQASSFHGGVISDYQDLIDLNSFDFRWQLLVLMIQSYWN